MARVRAPLLLVLGRRRLGVARRRLVLRGGTPVPVPVPAAVVLVPGAGVFVGRGGMSAAARALVVAAAAVLARAAVLVLGAGLVSLLGELGPGLRPGIVVLVVALPVLLGGLPLQVGPVFAGFLVGTFKYDEFRKYFSDEPKS